MNIILPFNRFYLKQRYDMNEQYIDFLSKVVLSNVLSRLSMDSRIASLVVVGDFEIGNLSRISTKIEFLYSDTSSLTTANQVVSNYFSLCQSTEDLFVFYNPLYPFVSIDKINFVHNSVAEGTSQTGIGGISTQLGCNNAELIQYSDQGIFTVLRKSTFLTSGEKIEMPVDIVGLSAIELISLRSYEDFELFELIINSGMR